MSAADPQLLAHATAQDRAEWQLAGARPDMVHPPPRLSCVSLSLPDAPARIAALRASGRITLALATAAQKRERGEALTAGVTEFLTTGPIHPADLGARVQLLATGDAGPRDLVPHPDRPCATLGPKDVGLRVREAAILRLLWGAKGRFITHKALLTHVWGPNAVGRREYLRVAIKGLRDRLEPEPDLPRYLLSEAAIGYRLGNGAPRDYMP